MVLPLLDQILVSWQHLREWMVLLLLHQILVSWLHQPES
jgi:hypothetical protein